MMINKRLFLPLSLILFSRTFFTPHARAGMNPRAIVTKPAKADLIPKKSFLCC